MRIGLKLQKDGICHEGCELERDWILVLACSGEDYMEVVKDGLFWVCLWTGSPCPETATSDIAEIVCSLKEQGNGSHEDQSL